MGKAETYLSLVVIAALVSLVMASGSIATVRSIPMWYATLKKPSWNPPNWVFAPVWTILYVMMTIAAWLVYLNGGFAANKPALTLFLVQLILNGVWSPLFFSMHKVGAALLDIVLLVIAVAATTVFFWLTQPVSGLLMAPYLIWITFAAALNYCIWRLNR